MTKHDDTYTCEHCGRYFYIDRVNGMKGPVRHECTCGRMGRGPVAGYPGRIRGACRAGTTDSDV